MHTQIKTQTYYMHLCRYMNGKLHTKGNETKTFNGCYLIENNEFSRRY